MRTTKKLAAILMLVSFIFATVTPAMALTDYSPLEKITNIAGENGGNARGNSSTIYFGTYWQTLKSGATSGSTNLSDYNKEGIKWRVLSNDDGKTFLLSDQSLYADKFNEYDYTTNKYGHNKDIERANANKWAFEQVNPSTGETEIISSDIRTTLNSRKKTEDDPENAGFAGDAFSAKEYAAIADTTHTAGGDYTGKDIESTDKIFLLSVEEARNTAYGFTDINTRKAPATEMAQHVKMYDNSEAADVTDGSSDWWLRSPGNDGNAAYLVDNDGYVAGNYGVGNYGDAARAALNLNQESVLLLSAAVGGKGDVAVGGGFALDTTYAGADGWKLTLKDDSIAKPTNVEVTQTAYTGYKTPDDLAKWTGEGGTLDLTAGLEYRNCGDVVVSYSGKDANANFVSAVAATGEGTTDSPYVYENYAKISDQTSETEKGVDITNLDPLKEYTLFVFAEQANGDYQTDYASETQAFKINNTAISNEGVLSTDYAAKALTANLGGGFNLSFENDTYNTGVTVAEGETGTITADETDGTILTGNISVGNGATLTIAKAFTLDGAISGEGTTKIAGNVTANADIATTLTVDTAGELTASADSLKNNVTNSGIVNFKGGTLAKNYTSTGTTNFKGAMKFSGAVSLTNSTVNFYLDGFKAGDTIVTSDKAAALDNAEIGLYQITDTDSKLTQKGDKITLISSAEGYGYTEEAPNLIDVQGGMVEDTYGVYQSATGALEAAYIESGLIDQTKSFSEARLAGSAAINSASDLVASAVMENATAETKDWEAFAAVQGAHSRYETGSHIDLNSFNVAAGLSKKVKDNVTLGLFVEGGNGRYTTYNEFEDGDVRADGDINYFGGGVFAKVEGKKTAKGQLHGEASFRAGHINSDYNSENFDEDMLIRFDTSNAYLGMHAGIGYKWNVKDGSNVDTYVKYLWNRQNSDSPTIAEKKFDLDAINSHRLRAGFRYNSKENNKGIKFFGGLAYEYEFDGTAKGHMGEYSLLEPDFKGGSGMAELGIKYHKANSPWKVELGVTGYTGKRDSIGASLGATYEFGK